MRCFYYYPLASASTTQHATRLALRAKGLLQYSREFWRIDGVDVIAASPERHCRGRGIAASGTRVESYFQPAERRLQGRDFCGQSPLRRGARLQMLRGRHG